MAIRLDYVVKETGSNLVRNITLTLASVLTVAIALAFVGVSHLIGVGIEGSFGGLQSDVRMFVYMNPTASAEQIESVRKALEESPQVDSIVFLDQTETYKEFKRLFKDQPDFVESINPEELPQSFRIKPKSTDTEVVSAVGKEFENLPGVYKVEYASKLASDIKRSLDTLNGWITKFGFALIAVSVMLIFNTIRTAVFARRREIEVMRLVGASNWFIRLPFIVEGMVQGLIGAIIAAGLTWSFDVLWHRNFVNQRGLDLLNNITWETGNLIFAVVMVLTVGAVAGAIGSGVAVGRYLRA
ncbi:MAG: permease-like cell division protein FtsX [Microthrixaceae bacterium]